MGCKVTGPVDGSWHYEFAVHNVDHAAAGAALHIPVCPSARVRNAGFRDIDRDANNEWAYVRTAAGVSYIPTATNPLVWNTLYNFWFDCDVAPTAGTLQLDRARPGNGPLTVSVAAQVPGLVGHEYLGAGCGTPNPELTASAAPTIPSPTHALRLRGTAAAPTALVFSLAGDQTPLGNGCTRFLAPAQVIGSLAAVADGAGLSTWSLPLPAELTPFDLFCQSAEVVANGPWLGTVALSNGLKVRVGGSGCQ